MNISPLLKDNPYEQAGINGVNEGQNQRDGNDLGQEEFLSLLTAQLANQDPFKPMENTDFIAQMAQFSSLEGIYDLSQSFESLAASLSSNQALQASSLVGHSVLIPSNVGVLHGEGYLGGTFTTEARAQAAVMQITDANGQLVNAIELGDLDGPDEIEFAWDGTDFNGNRMPSGYYQVTIEGNTGGENTSMPINIRAHVESVNIRRGAGDIILNLAGLGSVPLSDVKEIGI